MDYKIIELRDMSSAAKRISAKVIVQFNREEKDEIKKRIPKLIDEIRNQKVETQRTLLKHGKKPFEVVYLYLYRNIDELNHGIPIVRASFIDPNCKVKPMHFSEEYIDDNTTIIFDPMYGEMEKFIKEHKVSDEEFLKNVKKQTDILVELFEFTKQNLDNYDSLTKKYKEKQLVLKDMLEDGFVGFPNNKYMRIYREHQSLLASLSSIGEVLDNLNFTSVQKINLINLHFESAKESVEYLLANLE